MEIKTAQHEVRSVYLGGSVGQAVSSIIWLISAMLGTWLSTQSALIALTLGGVFIFPLTQLILKITGHKATLSKENPFSQLAVQVAFVAPLCLPLIGVIASYNVNYFYPAFMVAVGVHYLPFMFLYGIREFGILGGILIGGGTLLMMIRHNLFITGGWFTAATLLIFAVVLWFVYQRENRKVFEKSSRGA
jgi:hypothetical protein